MAEAGSRKPASWVTSIENQRRILAEDDPVLAGLGRIPASRSSRISDALRNELEDKGLKGFKKGGKVKKAGPAYLHKGEKVIPKGKVKKVEKAVRAAGRDKAMLKRARMR